MGTTAEPASILFGHTRRRVLGWLFGHADQAFYLRQIVRQTGAAQGAVQRELAALTTAGLLRRTVQGRQVYFQANRDSPIFSELQSLLLKTSGVVDILRRALAPLANDIVLAFIFGSAARNELRSGSDIDLLVVGNVPFTSVVDALAEAQRRIGRDVNPTIYPPAEFAAKIRDEHHFLTSVLREPLLFLIGGADELDRLGTQRLVDGASRERQRDSRASGGRRSRPRRQRG